MKTGDTIIVASGNKNKIREFSELFSGKKVISQKEAGFSGEAEETGETFFENALIKAKTACEALNLPVVADDSGLCVEALGGAPGVYSARFSGEHGDDEANRKKLLEVMQGEKNRTAYFMSSVVLYFPDGTYIEGVGKTVGKILESEEGENGFGYDCLFFSDDLQKSFGVASAEEKNRVSHRARAIAELKDKLEKLK